MEDRRQALIEAGLQLLREEGLAGFTQPKIAARAGLRQGNLTYYFPTRSDILAAVASVAAHGQLAAADELVAAGARNAEQVVAAFASILTRHETTRVLMGLAQAADQEPAVRAIFNELADGLLDRLADLLLQLGLEVSPARLDLIHAVLVGLSVVELATGRADSKTRIQAALEAVFRLLIEPA